MKLHRYRTLLCALCCFALALVAAAPGKALGQTITITTIDDLQKIGNDAAFPLDGDYELGSDIDATATSTWDAGAGFAPIGDDTTPFTGTFDGQGYVIRSLTIDRPATDYVGLFGYASGAMMKDTGIEKAAITGDDYTGGLVGYNEYGEISNCYSAGEIEGDSDGSADTDGYVGGLVGSSYFGSIKACESAARVRGNYYFTGGLVGYNEYAVISNCSTTGPVSGYYYSAGGLVGENYYGDISNCTSSGTVSSYYGYAGGLVGYSAYNSITNCSSTSVVVSDDDYVGGLVGSGYSCAISDSHATGAVSGYSDYTGGLAGDFEYSTMTNCYSTGTVNGYDYVGGLIGYTYAVAVTNCYATGVVNGYDYYVGGLVGYNEYGNVDTCYSESVTNGYYDVGGLIGYNYYCAISNSYATGTVTGNYEIGGLIGYNDGGKITDSYATGAVTGSDYEVGGLVGYNYYSPIANSYATGAVTGSYEVGGLVGYMEYANISSSYSTGAVSGSEYDVGGLVGYNYYASITMSYATGMVNAGGDDVGGLVGENDYGYISNCYSTGEVNGGYDYVGGLVGYLFGGYIGYSYATGEVNGYDIVGGLVGGESVSDPGTVRACFWDTETSGLDESDGGEGKTTALMQTQATFTAEGWNFTAIWNIKEGETYPLFSLPDDPDLPVAASDNYTTTKNTTLTIAAAEGVLANDTNPSGTGTLTAVLATGPANGSLTLNADGSFEYIPEKGFTGIDSFIYTATNGDQDSAPGTATITVGRKKLCPAASLYGERSDEVRLLRKYRDRVLKKNPAGSAAAALYYKLAPAVTTMLDSSPWLGRKARQMIDLLLPALQRTMER